jgi:glutathione peroxidase
MVTAHDFSFGKLASPSEEIALKSYAGSAVLVVNVASACGYTSQYRDLEALYAAKKAKGLVVLGAPCNDFGGQEAGSEDEILSFCESRFQVTFPMASKVDILGAGRHPFYQWVAREAGENALPRWNFHKFLIGKTGDLLDGFPSSAAPLGPEMITAIEKALAG